MGVNNEKNSKLNNNGKCDLNQSIKSTNNIVAININNDEQTNLNKSIIAKNINKDKIINLKQSIKSKYILIQILSVIKENRLLKIIKYNKEYQSLLEINSENYKKISGKIKLMGFNGYGKEYKLDSMELTFEGEYLNGEKNGKGKEYFYNGKLKF